MARASAAGIAAVLPRDAAAAGFHGPVSLQTEFHIPYVSDDQGIAIGREQDEQVMPAAERATQEAILAWSTC